MPKPKQEHKTAEALWQQLLSSTLPPLGIEVHTEVKVAKLPQKADLILIRKKRDIVHPLWSHLSSHNIVELKSAQDTLDKYDLDKLISYGLGYKRKEKIPASLLSLWLILPQCNKPLLDNLHELQERTFNTLLSGFHHTLFMEYPLYVIETNLLPLQESYLDLKLFAKKGIFDVLQLIIEAGKKPLLEERITVAWELYESELKEVLEAIMPKAKAKRTDKELIEMMIDTFGEERVIQSWGEKRMIQSLGEERVIRSIGKEKVLHSLGEEEVLKNLLKKFDKAQILEWMEE